MTAFVSLEQQAPLGIITLNRPPANSYNAAFVQDLADVVEQIARADELHVVILKSALEKFFSAGADVKSFSENPLEANLNMIAAEHAVLERIESLPKIFIAMISGHCLGGGLEIALACDLRFAANGDFKVGLPEVTLGMIPGNGGTQRLPRLIGKSRALDLMMTGRALNPQEAHALGIFDRLLAASELEAETFKYATSLANGPSVAIGAIKRAVNRGIELPLNEGLALERSITAQVFESHDAAEGINAFANKRKPVFQGK